MLKLRKAFKLVMVNLPKVIIVIGSILLLLSSILPYFL